MAFFFDPDEEKRPQIKSIEVMEDGAVDFGTWHDGPEKLDIQFTPASTTALLSPDGDKIDATATRRYTLLGSSKVTSARIFLAGTTPPRPYSETLSITVVPATTLKPPPLEKQATTMQCWAGALSSWTQATKSTTTSIQADLVKKYSDVGNGGASESRIRTVLIDLGFMSTAFASFKRGNIPLADIQQILDKKKYPVLIYKSSRLNSHTVVIYGIYTPSATLREPTLKIMDPWSGALDELAMSTLVGRAVLIANPQTP